MAEWMCDSWREVFAHDATGAACSGSLGTLFEAFLSGCELKVAVRSICDELADSPAERLDQNYSAFTSGGSVTPGQQGGEIRQLQNSSRSDYC